MSQALDWWPSPAKLNLFLHITGRQKNGYHHLQSLFQILDSGDELAFEVDHSGQLGMATPLPGVPEQDNLIIKAAQALQTRTGTDKGCNIHLNKRLPMGGGIGGGSSNAATTLVALNHLWGTGLTPPQLAEVGLELGADVPVFVHGHSAFAEGVGEILQPVSIPRCYYLVANPGVHISTAEVFNAAQLPRNTAKIRWQDYQFENSRNDCQQWVTQAYPQVANLLRWLLKYAPSRMTGTGASVFACFSNAEQAQQVLALLPAHYTGFVAEGCDLSPLQQKLVEVKKRETTVF